MASKLQALAIILPLLIVAAAADYDVEQRLADYTDYSTFLKYLADTKIADEITKQPKATILVVGNSAAAALSSLSAADAKKVISYHVILDYYDPYYFSRITGGSALIATFAGNINATYDDVKQEVSLGEPGAPLNCKVTKVVDADPYDYSVLEVTSLITSSGASSSSPAPSTPSASTPAPPTGEKKAEAPPVAETPEKSSPSTADEATDAAKDNSGSAASGSTPQASSSANASLSNPAESATATPSVSGGSEAGIASSPQLSDSSLAPAEGPNAKPSAAAHQVAAGAMAGLAMGVAAIFAL